ncbi:MAG: hypothetical protein R6V86_08560 [Spirochaetia bacterium]
MLVRYLLLFILSLGLLSGCASGPAPAGPEAPQDPPSVQENTSPQEHSEQQKSDASTETETETRSNENSPPEVSVEELIPKGDMPQDLSPIAEVEFPMAVEVQPVIPQASLPDRLPESQQGVWPKWRSDFQPTGVSSQLNFLLLSPQLSVHALEEEAVQGDSGEPQKPGEPRKETASESPSSDSASSTTTEAPTETSDTAASQGSSDAQGSEKADKVSEPSQTEEKAEIIRAEPGEQVHLTLPGLGWIYDQGASKAQGVEFQSRNYKDNSTEFVFIAQSIGSYTLSFQQQDSRLGSSSFRTVAVDVGPHTTTDQKEESPSTGEAADIGAMGNMEAEEEEFSFARLKDSISSRNPSGTEGQLKAMRRNRPVGDLFSSGKARQEELALLVEAGEFLFEAQRESTAEQALRLYLDLTEERGEHTGQVLYLLGQIYESPLPPRDERQSAEYYRKIVSFYPTDPYRRRAEQRIKYLQRHFLQIR